MVREFVVRPGCEEDFALVFQPGGIWDDLVRSSAKGYRGCELLRMEPGQFELRDYWASHWEFEAFRGRSQEQIELFRRWMAGKEWIEREELLGMFYVDEHGFDEGTGLVST